MEKKKMRSTNNEILNIHNSSHFPLYYFMNKLNDLGYLTDFDCRISRTIVWSTCPRKIADVIFDLVNDCDWEFIDEHTKESDKYWEKYDSRTGAKR